LIVSNQPAFGGKPEVERSLRQHLNAIADH